MHNLEPRDYVLTFDTDLNICENKIGDSVNVTTPAPVKCQFFHWARKILTLNEDFNLIYFCKNGESMDRAPRNVMKLEEG